MAVQKYISGSTAVEIAASIEAAIHSGALAPGAPLPTVRAGASEAGVSPATLAAAYARLRARGLLVAKGRQGTFVSPRAAPPAPPPVVLPRGVRDLASGNPDPAMLPALGPALRTLAPPRRLYGEALNDPELIVSAQQWLASDGAPSAHVAVVSGALDGIERALQVHLRPGDRVAVEDPAFSGVLALLESLGLEPSPVALDQSGMLPDALERALRSGVRAVLVTPRAQNPSGAAFDASRIAELSTVLDGYPSTFVVEDDHASAVSGAPAHTLCTGRIRFALARSYAKALGPDLRLAVLSTDPETAARLEARQRLGMRWVSHILQRLALSLWRDASVQQRMRRAAQAYTERRSALIAALALRGIPATGRSGLNVWIPVPEEAAVAAALLDAGYAVSAGERFRLKSGPGIRVTTAALPPEEAEAFAAALAKILRPSARTHAT